MSQQVKYRSASCHSMRSYLSMYQGKNEIVGKLFCAIFFMMTYMIFFCILDRFSLYNRGFVQTCNPPASTFHVLWLQTCACHVHLYDILIKDWMTVQSESFNQRETKPNRKSQRTVKAKTLWYFTPYPKLGIDTNIFKLRNNVRYITKKKGCS